MNRLQHILRRKTAGHAPAEPTWHYVTPDNREALLHKLLTLTISVAAILLFTLLLATQILSSGSNLVAESTIHLPDAEQPNALAVSSASAAPKLNASNVVTLPESRLAPWTPTSVLTTTSTVTATATSTHTATSTNTPAPTATFTPQPTATSTSTSTATVTHTPRPTNTATNTPAPTATFTPQPTVASTHTSTATATHTPRPTNTATETAAPTATFTPQPTATHTSTSTATATHTPRPTNTATNTPKATSAAAPTSTLVAPTAPMGSVEVLVQQGCRDIGSWNRDIVLVWKPVGGLSLGSAFAYEVVAWKQGDDPLDPSRAQGLYQLTTMNMVTLNRNFILQSANAVNETGVLYHWGVVLVRKSPYERIRLLSPQACMFIIPTE